MSGKNINLEQAGVGGAKRKNGHKMDCECHICENMNKKAKRGGYKEDIEKQMLQRMGGSKKKNGHKPDCGCPICKNMKNANKKGGDQDEDIEKQVPSLEGGKKKKGNGHKVNCGCPICKNMKKSKKGGEDPDIDIESGLRGDIEEGVLPAQTVEETVTSTPLTVASSDEYDLLDAAEKGEAGPNMVGGTRKKRGNKRSARKNMLKSRKTRRHRKRTHRRR